MGITDIDDKIIAKGKELGLYDWSLIEPITRKLEDEFFKDLDELNVRRPDAVLRVTEHIQDIINYIKKLETLGFTYIIPNDGVYFNVALLGDSYGKLCAIPPSNIEQNMSSTTANVQQHQKKNWRDFALWKFTPHTQIQESYHSSDGINSHIQEEPGWMSNWGRGRPGWHIECSAMTQTYFGNYLDIHSGGVDLMFPHHTNEIAQR